MLQCTDNFAIVDFVHKSTDRAAHVNVSRNANFSLRSRSKKKPLSLTLKLW